MGEEGKQEQTKAEEKKEEPKPPLPFVLFVDLHCVGCAKKIERSLSKIKGVEEVVIDMAKNEVSIRGVVEPEAVCNRIMKRTKRRAKLLSPLPQAVAPQMVTGLTTVELNVNMHCEACAGQLKNKILKMKGVRTVETELSSGKVTVMGTMDADRLVDYVNRRTRKHAKIVPQPHPEPEPEKTAKEKDEENPAAAAEEEAKPEEKKEEKAATVAEEAKPEEKNDEAAKQDPPPEEEKKDEEKAAAEGGESKEYPTHRRMYYHHEPFYWIERIPAPQLFSDENPNACCIV